MQEELEKIQAKISQLEHANQKKTESFQQQQEMVSKLTKEMDKAADVASTVTE